MIDRSHIGFTTTPTSVPVDAWRVKLFCQAIGETNPVHWDPDAARAAGHAACPVPPTFLKSVESEHFSTSALMQFLNVPLVGVLHAEQQFTHLSPVHVGDTIEVARRVESIFDKKDGALTFVVTITDYRVEGRSVAQSTQTILVRNRLPA